MSNILVQDMQYGFRRLLKSPGTTALVILTLALGIGANSAVFSVVNTVLLRPLPFEDPERLVALWQARQPEMEEAVPVAPANFLDWRAQSRSFEDVAAHVNWTFTMTGEEQPERVESTYVSPSLFRLLGTESALIGRIFVPEEEQPGKDMVAVLGNRFWRERFGADPGVLGKTIKLDGDNYTVVGVMPAEFEFPRDTTDLWLPIAFLPEQAINRGAQFLSVMARLKPGVTIEAAQRDMETISRRLGVAYPETNKGWGVKILSLHEQTVGDVRPALLLLVAAVGFVLLIACTNVANLLLSQAVSRQQEIAVRTALGADRSRLVRQLLTESIVVSLLGGILGLLLASSGMKALFAMNSETIPRQAEIGLDGRVVLFTLGLSLLTGLIFGLVPALETTRRNLTGSLKEGGRGFVSSARQGVRSAIVIAEVALALIMLVGAGLMARSFLNLRAVNPGFDPEDKVTMKISLPDAQYDEPGKIAGFYRQLLEQLMARSEMRSVGAISFLPLEGSAAFRYFSLESQPPRPGEEPTVGESIVSPGYFQAMEIPLLKGRSFNWQDTLGTPDVAVVSQSAVEKFWPGRDPIGQRVKFGEVGDDSPWLTVVGIVGDVKHMGLGKETRPEVYVSFLQSPRPEMSLVASSDRMKGSDVVKLVRNQVHTLNQDIPISDPMPLEQVVAESITGPRFYTVLLGILGLVALILTTTGIAGVMSHTVNQRTHEIGIRMALGAERWKVLRLMLGRGLRLAILGIGVGLVGALLLGRFISGFLFGVSEVDIPTFSGISLLLALVTLVAAYFPAARATRVSPVAALRYE
jgi:predicted permease